MLLAVAAAGCSRAQGPSLAPALLQVLSADGLPGPTRTCNEAPSPGPRLAGRFHENESCSVVSDSLRPHGLHGPWDSPGQNTGVGSLSLLQGIFPTQGSNPGLPPCRWVRYQLSHKGDSLRSFQNEGLGKDRDEAAPVRLQPAHAELKSCPRP